MWKDLLWSLLLIHLSSLYMMNLESVCNLLDVGKEMAYTGGLVLLLLGNLLLKRPWLVPLLLPVYLLVYLLWFHNWVLDYLWSASGYIIKGSETLWSL